MKLSRSRTMPTELIDNIDKEEGAICFYRQPSRRRKT